MSKTNDRPRFLWLAAILLIIIINTIIVYLMGGTACAFPHLMYIPIIIVAFAFDLKLTIMTAFVCGMAMGPWMPKNVAANLSQATFTWIFRLFMYNLIGIITSLMMTRLKKYREKDIEASYFNIVTGRPNENKLKIDVEKAIEAHQKIILMAIQIINMDDINRTLNYDVGVAVTKKVGELLDEQFEHKMLYSIFIHEYIIMLPETDLSYAQRLAEAFLIKCEHPLQIGKYNIQIMVKIGLVNYPKHAANATDLLKKLGTTLSQRKDEVGVFIYNSEAEAIIKEHQLLIDNLYNYYDSNAFLLNFQPIINLKSAKTIWAEALLRVDHRDINIEQLISCAEEIGFINQITRVVILKTVTQIHDWMLKGKKVKVSINISLKDLRDEGLVNYIIETCKQYEVPPQLIEIEITERELLENEDKVIAQLKALKDLDIQVSLDDYGTGYNALINLVKLPIDHIKIDKLFIDDIDNELNRIWIEAVIRYAHKMGKQVIAEGVEQETQAITLKQLDCDYIQGYLYSKPLPPQTYFEKLDNQS